MMKIICIFTFTLLVFLSVFPIAKYSQKNDVRIVILSQEEMVSPKSSDMIANVRVRFRIKNLSDKSMFILGNKYEDSFELFSQLITYNVSEKKWISPSLSLEQIAIDEKETKRIKKGDYFDFYITLSRRVIEKRHKVKIYYTEEKQGKSILDIKSDEFVIDASPE